MASAKRVKHSRGFYRDLNEQSTSGFFENNQKRSTRGMFEVERIVSSKSIRNKVFYLCRWKGYGPLSDTWEPEENLNMEALRSFKEPVVSQVQEREGIEAFGLGVLKHLRAKHGNCDTSTTVEMRHDVFRSMFRNKGRQSRRKGWFELNKEDFSHCQLPATWDRYIDHLGDGKKITFPVLVRPVLQLGPKSYIKQENGQFQLLPRYYRETVRICFSTSAYSVNL